MTRQHVMKVWIFAAFILLVFTAQKSFAREYMAISRLGISQPVPYEYRVAAMIGDSLALYDYAIAGNTVMIKRGIVSPDAQVRPMQAIYSFQAEASWGDFSPYPLYFEYKNGKLYSAFRINERVLVLFTDVQSTVQHVVWVGGISLGGSSSFVMVNEQWGWCSAWNYPEGGPVNIFKISLSTNSLHLFYSTDPGDYGVYQIFQLTGGYFLMTAEPGSSAPDLLTDENQILHTYPQHWWQLTDYYMYSYALPITQQLSLLNISDGLDRNQDWLMIVWVEDNDLHSAPIPNPNPNPYTHGYIYDFIPHAAFTFSSIYGIGQNYPPNLRDLNTFKNWQFSDGILQETAGFPDLSLYPGATSYFRMDANYSVAISRVDEGPFTFTLVDYSGLTLRSWNYAVNGYYSCVYHSDSHFYLRGYDGRIHCFALVMSSPVSDESAPEISSEIGVYPNPFSGRARIDLSAARGEKVKLSVYNIRGQKVKDLYQGRMEADTQSLDWQAQGLAPGVYFIKLESNAQVLVRKVLLIR